MVRFVSLSSGSNGNCYYIGNERTALLIDFGIGIRTANKRLTELGLNLEHVSMVLVTHDHVDHIKSLGNFTERFRKPVFATRAVCNSLRTHYCTRGKMGGCMNVVEPGVEMVRDGISITPFSVPHDATDTVGYHIVFDGESFTFLTDVGDLTDDVIRYSRMARHLIVESNYDVDMLLSGNYPKELKLRIMQGHGHLSNEQTASLLKMVFNEGLSDVYLCHLSENNNTPSRALACARAAVDEAGGDGVSIACLPRRKAEIFEY